MLKKLFTIGMFACVMSLACNVFAQDEKQYAPEYPHYGFWSNWSLGGQIGVDYMSNQKWALGANLLIQKELNHVWNFRTTLGAPRVLPFGNGGDRYAKATFGFTFNPIAACKGYDPDRKFNFYLLADGGANFRYDASQTVFGQLALLADFGLGISLKTGEHSTFSFEAVNDFVDVYNPFGASIFGGAGLGGRTDIFLGLGYMYNFGPTATDLEMIAQKALLTQENVDNLNNQIAQLEQEVANSKKAEQRLENRINDLENELANVSKRPVSNTNADSLQNIINNMKADQLNFYALPFSILYAVDDYQVSDDQQDKLKAIARVMKDNENMKFAVVGFCDHTGSDAYNMKLSQKRAENVKNILVNKYGIDEDRLSCDWKGKANPFGDVKMSINRRVSFYRVIE